MNQNESHQERRNISSGADKRPNSYIRAAIMQMCFVMNNFNLTRRLSHSPPITADVVDWVDK